MDDLEVAAISMTTGWRLLRNDASSCESPADLDWAGAIPDAVVPGTVASTLIGAYVPGKIPEQDYDDFDWWYQCDFEHDVVPAHCELAFDGLATIADVWLNDELILESRNMFRSYRIDVSDKIRRRNTLTIAFRSINRDLKQKRPRPRWKTNLIRNQQLRWIRTTLLGRIPGWTPAIAPVGPWRAIRLENSARLRVTKLNVAPSVNNSETTVSVQATLECVDPQSSISVASLRILGKTYDLAVSKTEDCVSIDSSIVVADAALWSPQSSALHDYVITVQIDGAAYDLRADRLGFRDAEVDRTDGRLGFRINGQDIFCRGACWTTDDILSLDGSEQSLRNCLTKFRAAGGNMIRVGGTMVYESDAFYRLCDELGILVWQDFMFANMDYPSSDTHFLQEASAEVDEQTRRLNRHACVVVYCGNSEVEQQSAMFGMTSDLWQNHLFYEVIPKILESNCPGAAYFPSSPSEGALPFHNATGPSHYFGVGAYMQPLASIEKARVKFTSECLAFSNVPSDWSLIEHFQTTAPPVHQPKWKAGVPRDSAAGWDFEDIRDHYIKELYGVDPVTLRYADKDRYIAISQVATGEVIERAFNFWRGTDSDCSGALIWQMKDIVPGAGWGFIDSDGRPKPLYYFLKRCWGDIDFALLDRGLDGLGLRVINESSTTRECRVNVKLLQHSMTIIADVDYTIQSPANGVSEVLLDELLGRFYDVTYRYRFGPSKHDVVVATLIDESGCQRVTRCYFPNGHNIRTLDHADIDVRCRAEGKNFRLDIRSGNFLQHVKLYSRTHEFDDNYFHLSPTATKSIVASPIVDTDRPLRGVLSALNLSNPIAFS